MKLCTMTNLYYVNTPDGKGFLNSVCKNAEMGFMVQDFNMCAMQRNETELNGDNWEEITYEIANEAAKLGVEFAQSHIPYAKVNARRKTPFDEGCEQNEHFVMLSERAVRISGMLGVKWAVAHPVQDTSGIEFDPETDIKYNHFIYDKYVELADKLGVGIAFENMADVDGYRRFGVTASELISLVDSFSTGNVGICWDFGHANRAMKNQQLQILKLGDRLKATHLDDNKGKDDLHTIPFFGSIDWNAVMHALYEIGYDGALNYEIAVMKRVPDELKDYVAKLLYETGKYLIGLAK